MVEDTSDQSDDPTEIPVEATSEGGPRSPETAPDGAPGVTATEEAALERVRAVSRLLDEAVRVPGTDFRVGIDPLLGLLSGVGDVVSLALSLYPVAEAYRIGVPGKTLAKMLGLVAVDAVVGSVPVVGTVFDAVWKANEWNARALERFVEGA